MWLTTNRCGLISYRFNNNTIQKNDLNCDKHLHCNINNMDVKNVFIKPTSVGNLLTSLVEVQYNKKMQKNIWDDSDWKHVADLENDYVGKIGENFMQSLCDVSNIWAEINGLITKQKGGGAGDGKIKGRTVEIKTARLGAGYPTFQHELGEKPWLADFMIFVDIAPSNFYISIFPNFTEEQYMSCCKCLPYFPTKSFCRRKKMGCFKLDTTIKINDTQSEIENGNTFCWTSQRRIEDIGEFINRIIL